MLKKAGGIIRGVGLRESLAGILSEEQLAAFDQRQERDWKSQVETHARRELSKLLPLLELTDAQREQTLELLKKSSADALNESADVRAFLAMQRNQSLTQVELTDLAEAEFLYQAIEGPNPLAPNSPEFREQLAEVVGDRIHRDLELLAPVLDDIQLQRYRDHLIRDSLLPTFRIELPDIQQPSEP